VIRRREFIAGVGAAAWPLAAFAQQPGKLRSVGFLGANSPSVQRQWTSAFVGQLKELGWTEGHNLAIEYRWAEGRFDRSPRLAAELVQLNVEVIVTHATANVIAAMQATSVIPIVFAVAGDPVGDKLVASLARPGGNVTGLTNLTSDLAGKRLEFLRRVVPGLRRLAILANVGSPSAVLELREAEAVARKLGVEVVVLEIRRAEELVPAFAALKDRVEALYIAGDPLVTSNRVSINTLALGARLPTMFSLRENVEAGGLMSYGPNLPDQFRRAADFVDKILRGANPADIPVEQPTRFDLLINLITARTLGVTIPETLLATADEVIQ
jgi:putative ABC transport system substrate-binding protein